MSNIRKQYSYSILRYYHDNATGEFINVGVALYSKETGFFDIRIKTTTSRVSEAFPGIDHSAYKSLMKGIQNRYEEVAARYSFSLNFGEQESKIENILKSITPVDDSALKWSEISSGISADLKSTLENLYSRYITKYVHKKPKQRRTDEDVWRLFKKDLSNRKILDYFDEKIIQTQSNEVKFPLAWKNGIWHCIEPMSFDLSAPESIQDKANKCLGLITSVHKHSLETFKVYLLLSKPSDIKLHGAFDRALTILNDIPVEKEIYLEREKVTLVEKLEDEIRAHVKSQNSQY